MIRIVAGLGNPGRQYEDTRHNLGFMVLDELAMRFGLSFREKFNGMLASAEFENGRAYFIKPLTYMNLSGKSVGELAEFYKVAPEEVLVVHDEMNLPFGRIKIRRNGSAGGHNGLLSIIESLGSDNFPRIKMGIGRRPGDEAVSHVLGRFTPEEKKTLGDLIDMGAKAVTSVAENGLNDSMAEFNR